MNGKLKKQLTKGEWNVSDIKLVDEENEKIYFESNKGERLEHSIICC